MKVDICRDKKCRDICRRMHANLHISSSAPLNGKAETAPVCYTATSNTCKAVIYKTSKQLSTDRLTTVLFRKGAVPCCQQHQPCCTKGVAGLPKPLTRLQGHCTRYKTTMQYKFACKSYLERPPPQLHVVNQLQGCRHWHKVTAVSCSALKMHWCFF